MKMKKVTWQWTRPIWRYQIWVPYLQATSSTQPSEGK